jgi:hypothetical protein
LARAVVRARLVKARISPGHFRSAPIAVVVKITTAKPLFGEVLVSEPRAVGFGERIISFASTL